MVEKKNSLLDAISDFVNRERDPKTVERVKHFSNMAREKGLLSSIPIIRKKEEIDNSPVLAFFAPVGYRPLFEQELIFLMNEGMQYDSILRMPINIRKALIDKKVKPKFVDKRLDEIPDMPTGKNSERLAKLLSQGRG